MSSITQPVKSPVSKQPFTITPLSQGVGVDVGVGEAVAVGVGVGVGPGGAQYLPPVFKTLLQLRSLHPPQAIISLPVHNAV